MITMVNIGGKIQKENDLETSSSREKKWIMMMMIGGYHDNINKCGQ